MTDEPHNILVDELLTMLGPPEHTDDVGGYLDRLAKMTEHFGQSVLTRAAAQLVQRAQNNRWPAPNEILGVCADVQDAIADKSSSSTGNEPWHKDARRAREWAREFCRTTELGMRAFREGWGRKVYEWAQSFAREHYRRGTLPKPNVLPTEEEVNYWVSYCRVPKSWLEIERTACLREPFEPDTDMRLKAKITALREGRLGFADMVKKMPTEQENDNVPTIRPEADHPRPVTPDQRFWAERFGKKAAGIEEAK